jgi:hypothetical protein
MKTKTFQIFYRDSIEWGELTWSKWHSVKFNNEFQTQQEAENFINANLSYFKNMTLTIFPIFE